MHSIPNPGAEPPGAPAEHSTAACRDNGYLIGYFCMKRNVLLLSKNRMNKLLPFLRGLGAFALPFFIALSSCSKDDPVTSERSLCQGKSGLAARITGTGTPISLCIPNDSIVNNVEHGVRTTFDNSENWYLIEATAVMDTITFEFGIAFYRHSSPPVSLAITGNMAEALASPETAWFFYKETKTGEGAYQSFSASGELRVTFNDEKITVGTFSGVLLNLEDEAENPVGQRTIGYGFFNVSIDA